MLKIYRGNLIYVNRTVGEDFSVKVKIFYRYGFKVVTTSFKETLSEELTLKDLIAALKETIDGYDKILKL